MKKGTKLLLAMLSLFGAGAVLTACSFDANQSNVPTTSINKDVKSDTTEVSETEDTRDTSSTTQSQTEASESSTSEEIIDPAQLLHFEDEIEAKLKNKLNDRIGMEYVTNVDAKYFTLKDVDSTKVLEANGSISIVGKQEESEVSLGMPITLEQYQNLSNEDFASYSESSNLAENYNLQNLEEVDNILSAESLTFSYATKNSETWNLETVSASEIEAELEAKFTESIRQFFTQRSNNPYFSKTDLRTVTIRTNNYIFGDCFTLEGNVTHERTNTDLSCSILIVPNAENFDLMQSTFSTEGDETKDLSENYTLEQLNILKNVCEVSRIRSYEINGSGYMVQNTSNSENTL